MSGLSEDVISRSESDGLDAATAIYVGQLLDFYGETLAHLLTPDWEPTAPALLRHRRGTAPNDAITPRYISRALYIARAWRDIYMDLMSELPPGEADPTSSQVDVRQFGAVELATIRSRLQLAHGDIQAEAREFRRYFGYSPQERIHLRVCAFKLGVIVVGLKFPPSCAFDGFFQRDTSGSPTIIVNLRHRPPGHFEYVLGHELYHLLMHDGQEYEELVRNRSSLTEDQSETDADEFAGHLLLPTSAIPTSLRDASGLSRANETLANLVSTFKVSRATLLRQIERAGVPITPALASIVRKSGLWPNPSQPGEERTGSSYLPRAMLHVLSLAADRQIIARSRIDDLVSIAAQEQRPFDV